MTEYARSTIAALCFAKPTRIDFQTLKRELAGAFEASHGQTCRITDVYDDFISYDLDGGRVCLGYVDFTQMADFPHADALPTEGLIVSVGNGPGTPNHGPLFENREELCRGLAQEIERASPADHLMIVDHDGIVGAEVYDQLVAMVRDLIVRDGPCIAVDPVRIRPTHPTRNPSAPVVRTTHPSANACALNEVRQRHEIEKLRDALLHDAEGELEAQLAQRLTRRLAINTMNSGVILLSAPIGMAALTCCVLGREHERVPAHALALTGAVMGVMQSGFGVRVLSHLV